MEQIKPTRYIALDVLRGMTVAGMILVNNPGSWGHIFKPLDHAEWVGCTPTDLVFPFFLFIVGAAMAFSFAKYQESISSASVKKLLFRGFKIFLVGLLLNAFPFYPSNANPDMSFSQNMIYYWQHVRVFGVLQRIALCYVLGGLLALWLKKPKKIIPMMAFLIAAEWLILYFIGDHTAPFLDKASGALSRLGQGSGAVDAWLVGETHIYHGEGFAFDPEGIIGVLTGACTVLLGFMIGNIARTAEEKNKAVAKIYTIGMICLGIGCILGIWLPICKKLWTGSYVFYAGGWAIVMLAFFIYFIDIKGKVKAFTPFRALGLNPLFAFVMAALFVKILGRMIHWQAAVVQPDGSIQQQTYTALSWFYKCVCVPICGGQSTNISSLLYAICYVAVFTLMAYFLYRKHIVIKL